LIGADVLTLGMAADGVRRECLPDNTVTYLRVHSVTAAQIGSGLTIPEAASEVRLHQVPASIDEAVAQVKALKAAAGARRVAVFSLHDLLERDWAEAQLRLLAAAGADDVAELPADRIVDLEGAVRLLRSAGIEPHRITLQHPVADAALDLIPRVQRAFDAHPCLQRFSPLPRIAPADKPTTGYDDVRMVALSRLALRHRSIEVDWSLYGPKLAQVALTFGADHLDAVSAVDDESLGRRRATLEDVERNIKAAGFAPKEFRLHP
jgi:aminodeoxyfutalosine synthase